MGGAVAPGVGGVLSAAGMVLGGGAPGRSGELEKRGVQPEPPSELTQVTSRLARLLISAWGASPLPAMVWMRATPEAVSTRLVTVRKALASPWRAFGVEEELRWVGSVKK